ncbi:MAG TPA: polyprenyl synthetase family protein [Acidobacteriota bacterium]|nr:polyprenyl synthetase family protein [Acidobacteriota bacterium]HNT18511.1 polyprenyl synthetase family protein [Acidobacteriota bacterium]HPA26643.1 polyprenyl synthetase family protein [Acidobacteriota bacterium]HQO19388.1 polyprenyl synthetase family protein [Acidobacteriota bacterium]HQQ46174.1 polyprenyl synthetase family protein [Acidobacteriota bacterium]
MTPSVFKRFRPLIEKRLESFFPAEGITELDRAMKYSLCAGGKRLRPILALCGYRAAGGGEIEEVLTASCALEMFHTYSLIHDDLPAMDNDDLRRGVPTNHKVFGEGLAILAGDALQTMGAHILALHPEGSRFRSRRLKASRIVLEALGNRGMAQGQAIDISAKADSFGEASLLEMHRMKTGCLLEASLLAGAAWAGAASEMMKILRDYSTPLGIAFQLSDDILDEVSSSEKLGKTAGKDRRDNKVTLATLWGLEKAGKKLEDYLSESLRALAPLGEEAQDLRDIARFVVQRES